MVRKPKKCSVLSINNRLQHCKFMPILHNLFIKCHKIIICGHFIPMLFSAFWTLKKYLGYSISDLIGPWIHGSPTYRYPLPVTRHIAIHMKRCKTVRTVISARLLRRLNSFPARKALKWFVDLFHTMIYRQSPTKFQGKRKAPNNGAYSLQQWAKT